MIDMAATAHSLRLSHRNALNNNIILKNRRSTLFGMAALAVLGVTFLGLFLTPVF